MLISKFCVNSDDLKNVGLQKVEMNRLGRFVALTGKNGAGKSRILDLLQASLGARTNDYKNINAHRDNINNLKLAIQRNPGNPTIDSWNSNILSVQRVLDTLDRITSYPEVVDIQFARFVPKSIAFRDPRGDSRAGVTGHYYQAKARGLEGFEAKCFSYIQALQDRYYEATHPEVTLTATEISTNKDEYLSFKEILKKLLKTDLKRSADGNAMIFERPLAESALSDGQKILLQFITGLHAQKETLDNCVFIMDEPENHLHPSALIEFLEALSTYAKNSQFWLATHSIPLLAYVAQKEPMSIWYVEDGTVSNAGHYPQKVLEGLIGNEEQIAALQSFTNLPAQFAATTFAIESLLPPKVADATESDPQISQIAKFLNLSGRSEPLTILDFGAGKGRLIKGLKEIFEKDNKNLSSTISYFALEANDSESEICKSIINDSFDDGSNRWFSSMDDFFKTQDEKSIDVVVMCNVLHEIAPNEWLKTFGDKSFIYRALKDDGYLLVIEDQRIPVGEKAHQYGFLVLDTQHLRTLFDIKKEDLDKNAFQIDDHRGDGRLKAHLISKELLAKITTDTRKKAIHELKETAKCEISKLRKEKANYKNGQLHGFWTQQFANASLYLDEI